MCEIRRTAYAAMLVDDDEGWAYDGETADEAIDSAVEQGWVESGYADDYGPGEVDVRLYTGVQWCEDRHCEEHDLGPYDALIVSWESERIVRVRLYIDGDDQWAWEATDA